MTQTLGSYTWRHLEAQDRERRTKPGAEHIMEKPRPLTSGPAFLGSWLARVLDAVLNCNLQVELNRKPTGDVTQAALPRSKRLSINS